MSYKGIAAVATRPDLSLLRYPGGKRKLIPLIAEVFDKAGSPIKLLVEPFAGGAAVSIAFLESGMADEIALSDKDDLVAGLWRTVFSDQAEHLAAMVLDAPLSITEWERLRLEQPSTDLARAYKCLYLNRTSFSGILHERSGPIGGRQQTGKFTLGCRFNKQNIARRILELSTHRDRVRFVRCQGYGATVAQIARMKLATSSPEGVFWYLDPPFFKKADKLYRHWFDISDHRQLSRRLDGLTGHWILSYDAADEAQKLYGNHPGFAKVLLSYNARIDTGERQTANEILVSNVIAQVRARAESLPIVDEDSSHRNERDSISSPLFCLVSQPKVNSYQRTQPEARGARI